MSRAALPARAHALCAQAISQRACPACRVRLPFLAPSPVPPAHPCPHQPAREERNIARVTPRPSPDPDLTPPSPSPTEQHLLVPARHAVDVLGAESTSSHARRQDVGGGALGSAAEQFGRGTRTTPTVTGYSSFSSRMARTAPSRLLHRVADEAAARRNHFVRIPRTKGGAPARGALVQLREQRATQSVVSAGPATSASKSLSHTWLGRRHRGGERHDHVARREQRVLRGPKVDELTWCSCRRTT